MATITTADANAWFKMEPDVLRIGGAWTIGESARLDRELRALKPEGTAALTIDASGVERLDSAGAWLLLRTRRALEQGGRKAELKLPERYQPLLENIEQNKEAPPPRPRRNSVRARLERIGRATVHAGIQGWRILGYLGRVTVETIDAIASPKSNLRIAAMVHQIEETGISALPIVGLLAFLVGVTLAYQGADQLKRFSAELFTINLLGAGVLREIGGLITDRPPLSGPVAMLV